MSESQSDIRTIRENSDLISDLIETQFVVEDYFWTSGEITNYFEGAYSYFDLEDAGYAIRCRVRKAKLDKVGIKLSNGTTVKVYGVLALYKQRSMAQIDVLQLQIIQNASNLSIDESLEILKSERLWPRKRLNMTEPPKKIIVITSRNNRTLADFQAAYDKEGGDSELIPYYVPLEGKGAAESISKALDEINQKKLGDGVAVIRGGGDEIKLATFNDLEVARAISRSELPVFTGIGHKNDRTLADEVADYAAFTPTDAGNEFAKLSQSSTKSSPSSNVQWNWIIVGMTIIILLLVFFIVYQNL